MKKKKFDCVQMKHQIQERQRKRLKGLSATEESQLIQTEVLMDPGLAKVWKTVRRTSASTGSHR